MKVDQLISAVNPQIKNSLYPPKKQKKKHLFYSYILSDIFLSRIHEKKHILVKLASIPDFFVAFVSSLFYFLYKIKCNIHLFIQDLIEKKLPKRQTSYHDDDVVSHVQHFVRVFFLCNRHFYSLDNHRKKIVAHIVLPTHVFDSRNQPLSILKAFPIVTTRL